MAEGGPVASEAEVEEFFAALEPEARRAEALRLDALFRAVTGHVPRMWRGGIVGYGRYRYRYASGREGESLATGFAPRQRETVLYIMPGYADFGPILDRLGPHRKGKSCLYLRRLDLVDETALRALIAAGLADLGSRWPVLPQ